MLGRVATRAGNQRERPAGQPDEVAIADIDRRQRELIAAVASALRDEKPLARHFGKDDGQEFGRDILRLGNIRKLQLPPAQMIGKMLVGSDRVEGLMQTGRADRWEKWWQTGYSLGGG